MGKTFVEDERPCDSCVNRTRYGCVSWNCEYINRDEAIKAWREKNEKADRKTENCSEKPNNCEVKNYCDDCLYTDICDDKAFFYACTSKATISKMEQVEDESKTQMKTQNSNLTFEKDECAKEYEELGLKELKELIEADRKTEPQTKLCRECDDYAGDGMYCASNHIVYDFSTSKGNCEPQTDCPWK